MLCSWFNGVNLQRVFSLEGNKTKPLGVEEKDPNLPNAQEKPNKAETIGHHLLLICMNHTYDL